MPGIRREKRFDEKLVSPYVDSNLYSSLTHLASIECRHDSFWRFTHLFVMILDEWDVAGRGI